MVVLLLGPAVARIRAAGPLPEAAGIQLFEKKIRPLLTAQCFKCHSTSAAKLKGNLLLDSRSGMLKGGDGGPCIVPGKPEQSLLIEAVSYTNADLKMPPKTPLPASAIMDLKQWILAGAPWPGEKAGDGPIATAATPPRLPPANYQKLRQEHWSWQPLTAVPVPAVPNATWARNDVDHFVLSKLQAEHLHPVEDAAPGVLLRRVTFDLTGLPPTPAEMDAFLVDHSPGAFERVVDRLLASPAFGERWGRHWLDVVRYAESTGSSRNFPYPFAWRYRDYVIDSFNCDKPYDRFIAEQVAGDLLPYRSPDQHNTQLVATGFLALGVKDLNERDRAKFMMDNVDEQIDTTTRSILALTVSCARCHDHKFDPIPQSDYYALAGIFRSTDILAGLQNRQGGGRKAIIDPKKLIQLEGQAGAVPVVQMASTDARQSAVEAMNARRLAVVREKLEALRVEIQTLRQQSQRDGKRPDLRGKIQEARRLQNVIDDLDGSADLTPAELAGSAMGVRDDSQPADARICIHGEADNLGASVNRGFVTTVDFAGRPSIDRSHSGRLELAQWLTARNNPLTARVMVNRIWEHLFGEGLVRTVDNFGTTGEKPSHPELLDFLARQFMQNNWSVKAMIRTLVMSHAYALSCTRDPEDFASDPDNRLLWSMSPRRLDAEEIRDAMLAASGQLERGRPIGSAVMQMKIAEVRPGAAELMSESDVHRSVYLPILRDLVPTVLEVFDFAEPTLVTGKRDQTTVATQALYLLNDPFVIGQSQAMAKRLLDGPVRTDDGRIALAYQLALGRAPTAGEKARALEYVNAATRDASPSARTLAGARSSAWASFCQAIFAGAEFRYLQ